jgi:hypothetical protein
VDSDEVFLQQLVRMRRLQLEVSNRLYLYNQSSSSPPGSTLFAAASAEKTSGDVAWKASAYSRAISLHADVVSLVSLSPSPSQSPKDRSTAVPSLATNATLHSPPCDSATAFYAGDPRLTTPSMPYFQTRIAAVNLLFHETVLLLYRVDQRREAYLSAVEVVQIFYSEYKASVDIGEEESRVALLPSFTFLSPHKIYAAAMLLLHAYQPLTSTLPATFGPSAWDFLLATEPLQSASRTGEAARAHCPLPNGSHVIRSYVWALEMLEYCEKRWNGVKGMRRALKSMGEAVLGRVVDRAGQSRAEDRR